MSDSEAVPNEESPPELDEDAELVAAAEEIEQDISSIAQQRDEYLALAQRLQAEFENYKKQTMRRNTEVIEHAGSRLAEKLLPVLDGFDNAIIQGVEGVSPLHKALFDTLQKEGLEVIATDGVVFDPNCHEAVLHEPASDDDEEPTVSETLRTGYAWKGKVLRPAMVKVRG
ncbi:MAG TPA: nucleotide exchange factor GrpE [Acidimicrobiales bacterium]|jgi:molecular chaperone GrpE